MDEEQSPALTLARDGVQVGGHAAYESLLVRLGGEDGNIEQEVVARSAALSASAIEKRMEKEAGSRTKYRAKALGVLTFRYISSSAMLAVLLLLGLVVVLVGVYQTSSDHEVTVNLETLTHQAQEIQLLAMSAMPGAPLELERPSILVDMAKATQELRAQFSTLFEGRRSPLKSGLLGDDVAEFLAMVEAFDAESTEHDVLTSLVQGGRAFCGYIGEKAAAHAEVAERNGGIHKTASLLVFVVDLIAVAALALIVFRPTVKQVEQEFDLQMDASAVMHEQEINTILASHKRNEQALELSEALLSEMDLPHLIPKVLSSSKSLIDCEAANLFLVNPRGELCVWSSSEAQFSMDNMGGIGASLPRVPDPFLGTVTVPEASGLVQYCRTKSNRVVNIRQSESMSSVASIAQSKSSEDLVQKPMVEQEVERCKLLTGLDVRSMLMCNVYKGTDHVGVIQVVNKKGSPAFSSTDEHLAQVFASNVAVAVANSTLYYRTEQSQRLLSTILDSIPSTVLTFSRAGHLLNVNHTSVKGGLQGRLDVAVMRAAPYSSWLNAPGAEAYMNDQLVEDLDLALREQCSAERIDVDLCLGGEVLSANYAVSPLTLPGDTTGGDQGCLLVIDDVSAHKRTKSALYRYLSPAVADKVLKDGSSLGGKRQQVTTMFSDIRGFTALSESSSPADVVHLLNDWFTEAVDSVAQHNGVLDKFIGDAFMAEFGVPYASSMDAHNACLAALDLQVRLERMNARRRAAGEAREISVGVGINIGPAICGNIGSEKRLEYTVIGDSVNVASRVEGCTKAYGVFCIITEDTRSHLKEGIICRELDFIRVVGKRRPVRIYELVGKVKKGHVELKSGALKEFAKGLELYRKREFAAALEHFAAAEEEGDAPAAVFAERCHNLQRHCPADWEPVYTFDSK